MKKYFKYLVIPALAVTCLFTSCKKFEPGEDNEEEVITTMNLHFTPAGGGPGFTYSFDDADGPGGNTPVQSEIVLAPNTIYNVELQLLNKTASPADTITNEVLEEAEAHRFYYTVSPGNNITVSHLDNDLNGNPLGINSQWGTGNAGNGTMTITLRHYPGTPPDKQTADPVNSPKSSTDINIIFTTRIL